MTDLGFFTARAGENGPFGDFGENCFSDYINHADLGGWLSEAGLVKGRHGRAEFHFWFLGYTKTGSDPILYLLLLIGEPATGPIVGDWLPTTTSKMTANTWTLSVEAQGADIRNNSCVGSGDLNFAVCAEASLVGKESGTPCSD